MVGSTIAVNLAPMIDVTFLLLIFFLVTTTFERAEGILSSELPATDASAATPLPISPIVVRLTPDGVTGCTILVDGLDFIPEDFAQLVDVLKSVQRQPGFDVQTPVVIVAEQNVRWDHVVECWNAALRAGCKRIAFAEP